MITTQMTNDIINRCQARLQLKRFYSRATNPSANVKCYVTYVTRLPTGREEGQFLALDLGGTNFRVILAELHAGSRSVRMKCHKHEVRA